MPPSPPEGTDEIIMVAGLLLLCCTVIVVDEGSQEVQPTPSPELALREVIGLSRTAFGSVASSNPSASVDFAWRFATPELRLRFGGYDGMHRALTSPAYRPLLEHRDLLFEAPTEVSGTAQVVLVAIEEKGRPVGYVLSFTRSPEGAWRLSALRPMGRPEPPMSKVHRIRI